MSSILSSNLHNEEKFAAYLMQKPEEAYQLDLSLILNDEVRIICEAITEITKANLQFTIDELFHYTKQKSDKITKDHLLKLQTEYTDFENIDFVVQCIKENYVKNRLNLEIIEEVLTEVQRGQGLDSDKLLRLADSIKENISQLHSEKRLLTAKDLVDQYTITLQKRNEGLRERSLGYKIIKDRAIRCAEPNEMTLLFGPSGVGKSAMAQNIQLELISKGVPVIKIGTENAIDSEMDRAMAMRLGEPFSELYGANRDVRFNARIERSLSQFSQIKNYIHIKESSLSLNDVDYLIMQSKNLFRQNGVFKDDEYCLVIIDLASMVKELSGNYGDGVEKGADEFHRITERHGVHTLLVVQANENRTRNGLKFKTPEEIDHHVYVDEDIMGGGGWRSRCRLVLSVFRPLYFKRKYFPDRNDEWELEEDIVFLGAIKNNNGPLFRIPFIFDVNTFRIRPKVVIKE